VLTGKEREFGIQSKKRGKNENGKVKVRIDIHTAGRGNCECSTGHCHFTVFYLPLTVDPEP
jgi:hypothetical protein